MTGILKAIEERIDLLHKKEQTIAQYVIDNPQRVVQMSITELAGKSQASAATISRFCKMFHFNGYTDLKMKLAAELAQTSNAQSYQDIVEGNPLTEIVSAIESNHIRSISDTTQLLDLRELQRAITALRQARQIDVYGIATSGMVAGDFYQKLIRIGKRSTAFTDPHMQVTSASGLTPDDAAIAISYSGETPETINALACAKERGATVISLTKYGTNTLSAMSDIRLFTSTLEEGMRRGDIASRIAQLHVIDILFMGMVSEQFDEYVPKLEQAYQMVKKYCKERGK